MSLVIPRTLVVLQPGYLPWLGFFDQMSRSDIFVLYDDVQFDKHGWRNRNRIKTPSGPHWLTVPVHIKEFGASILDVEIDNRQPWARKHIGTIRQFYADAPYLNSYLPTLKDLLEGNSWERISDLDIALIKQMCNWLGLKRQLVRSSELNIQGKRSERLLNLCLYFQAGHYLSGNAARNYLDLDLFASHDIEVEWQDYKHPVYPQLHGEFMPYLSALDLLLNCGDKSGAILAGGSKFPCLNSVTAQ
ncbi:MAG: WbqC family protein [Candidatus Melainabacteria bacterium]|nr:WbqC family protein [Candidatus Melainabacteria bacterium]